LNLTPQVLYGEAVVRGVLYQTPMDFDQAAAAGAVALERKMPPVLQVELTKETVIENLAITRETNHFQGTIELAWGHQEVDIVAHAHSRITE